MAVLAALTSCQKADLAEQNSVNTNGERVITAYFDNAGTKTTLDDNGVTPKWTGTETIRILNGSTFDKITPDEIVVSTDGKSITFTTTLSGTLYAVYPFTATSAEKIENDDIVPVTLSANQDGTFASANICVAKENDGSLAFKNVTSVLHLTQVAATTKVNEIIITTPSAYIAGTGTVDMSETTPTLALSSGLSKKIKVKSASPQSDYYIAVAPTTLPAGTAFGFATGSELGGTNLSEEKTIAANTIYNIGSMDASEIEPNTYHEYVEINGLKWATMNIGANNETEFGEYFAWGETVGHPLKSGISISDYVSNAFDGNHSFVDAPSIDNPETLPLDKDAANANWGGTWRMPTEEELDGLASKQRGTFASGSFFGTSDDAQIFLPAAGCGSGTDLFNAGERCFYWSSSLCTFNSCNACYLLFCDDSDYAFTLYGIRSDGQSVRALSD